MIIYNENVACVYNNLAHHCLWRTTSKLPQLCFVIVSDLIIVLYCIMSYCIQQNPNYNKKTVDQHYSK